VLLASGQYTENDVDIDELVRRGRELRGFWLGITQVPRSHPFVVRRLERLYGLRLFGERRRKRSQSERRPHPGLGGQVMPV